MAQEPVKMDRRFKNRNYVFTSFKVGSELAGKYSMYKGQVSAYRTRCNKKIEQDGDILKYQTQLEQIEKDKAAKLDFVNRKYNERMAKLNNELAWMVAHENGYVSMRNINGTTSFMFQGENNSDFHFAEIDKDGKVTIFTNLIGTVQPTKRQLALYEEYAALRSVVPQNPKQQKRIARKMKAIYKKDPAFIEKYTVLKIQEKLNSYYQKSKLAAQVELDAKVSQINLKAREDSKETARKLDQVKQRYTTYTDTLIKQKRYNFIRENIDEIAKFAKSLKLDIDRTSNPCLMYTDNGVVDTISYKEVAVAVMVLGSKKEVVDGKAITYVNREKANYFAVLLENEVFGKNNQNQSNIEDDFLLD